MGYNPFGGGGALIDDIPFEPGKGLTHKLLNYFLVGLRYKSMALSVQSIAMADAAVQLVLDDTPASGEVELIGNLLQVDPESSGAGENLTLPLASNMAGASLIIKNTGGENVVVKDGVTTVSTVLPGSAVIVWSDGVAWALYVDNGVGTVESAVAEQRQPGKVAPEVANDSVYDFWEPPIHGSQTAILIGVGLVPVDGLSTSAAGTYLLDAQKVTWDGGPTLVSQLASTFSLETSLTDQTLTVLVPLAGQLVVAAASRTYTAGQSLRLGAVSNNADLTGGNGILMYPVWQIL